MDSFYYYPKEQLHYCSGAAGVAAAKPFCQHPIEQRVAEKWTVFTIIPRSNYSTVLQWGGTHNKSHAILLASYKTESCGKVDSLYCYPQEQLQYCSGAAGVAAAKPSR